MNRRGFLFAVLSFIGIAIPGTTGGSDMATTMGYDITNREDIFMPENDIVDVRKQRMTDEDKRLITEWLGELWVIYTTCQRPFTPDDWPSLGAIKEKIVEEGKWREFESRAKMRRRKGFWWAASILVGKDT